MEAALLSPAALSIASQTPHIIRLLLSKSISQGGRFYIDADGVILSEYAKLAKGCDKIKTILNFLTLEGGRTFVKFKVDCGGGTREKLEIDVTACASVDRNILTDDDKRYAAHSVEIENKDILLFGVDRFDSVFRESRNISYGLLSKFLRQSLETMMMHKSGRKIEDLHNDFLTALMRQYGEDYGFTVADQSRAGSTVAGNVGELDLYILKGRSRPFSVIECLRSESFGDSNVVVPQHFDKLLHHYDKIGFLKNFLVTYCEAKDFSRAYDGYVNIISKINSNKNFKGKYKMCSMYEEAPHPNMRVLVTTHDREGAGVQVIHYFCDFS